MRVCAEDRSQGSGNSAYKLSTTTSGSGWWIINQEDRYLQIASYTSTIFIGYYSILIMIIQSTYSPRSGSKFPQPQVI